MTIHAAPTHPLLALTGPPHPSFNTVSRLTRYEILDDDTVIGAWVGEGTGVALLAHRVAELLERHGLADVGDVAEGLGL